jgi:hypothetical protein
MATTDFDIYTIRDETNWVGGNYGSGGGFTGAGDGEYINPSHSNLSQVHVFKQYIVNTITAIPDTKAISVRADFTKGGAIWESGNRGVCCGLSVLTGPGTYDDNGRPKGYLLNWGLGGGSGGFYSPNNPNKSRGDVFLLSISQTNSKDYEGPQIHNLETIPWNGAAEAQVSIALRIDVIPIRAGGEHIQDVVRSYRAGTTAGPWVLMNEKIFVKGIDSGYREDNWGHATFGSVGFYVSAEGDYDPTQDDVPAAYPNYINGPDVIKQQVTVDNFEVLLKDT